MNEYGILTDYITSEPIRPATQVEWERSIRAAQINHNGTFTDENGRIVWVHGGPAAVARRAHHQF